MVSSIERPVEEELDEFRKKWRDEVNARKHHDESRAEVTYAVENASLPRSEAASRPSELQPTSSGDSRHGHAKPLEDKATTWWEGHTHEKLGEEHHSGLRHSHGKTGQGETRHSKSGLDYYIVAAEKERQGNLGEALANYRKAFKLDPKADATYKAYYQKHAHLTQHHIHGEENKKTDASDFVLHNHIGSRDYDPTKGQDHLHDLAHRFSQLHVHYQPEDESKQVYIAMLPDEIIVLIFKILLSHHLSSLASISAICRKFFTLTHEPSLWRYLCDYHYPEPIKDDSEGETPTESGQTMVDQFGGDWRRLFIDLPRIRFDGVYISICHYMRAGLSENTWNQPIHMVTYYRYLRFFPDGTVLKYLSTDEPIAVVKLLTPEFRRKQVLHGTYVLDGSNLTLDLRNADTSTGDRFCMILDVKGTQRGRHNKLKWIEYKLYNDYYEDWSAFDLKLMKPYFFSRVLSYEMYKGLSAEYDDSA
ncbi:hypothetical protein BZG36_00409 [Bifiguratus adelaidae]|uniref:F-box domain-containing protein n=1 Tax=Bifiguratus adelaidae TaxID=1938954 RepID=A0A261Y831_9FUNG|nr:hypothetical protein BZG36_00409 [Bifiguratus adelaidae]